MGENFLQINKFHNNMLEMDQLKTNKFLPFWSGLVFILTLVFVAELFLICSDILTQ